MLYRTPRFMCQIRVYGNPSIFVPNLLYETTAPVVRIPYRTVWISYLEICAALYLNFCADILLGLHAPSLLYCLQLMLLYSSNKCCMAALGSMQNFSLKFVLSLSRISDPPCLKICAKNLLGIRANF